MWLCSHFWSWVPVSELPPGLTSVNVQENVTGLLGSIVTIMRIRLRIDQLVRGPGLGVNEDPYQMQRDPQCT